MSRAVQSQADVGNLSIAGLSAFSSILATLSADNVVPMALIQMEKLGAALPTSGEYTDKAKNLLQRCSDVRLDHLAIVIGWRKNDSSSLMAESAGGQAIALVSMCLTNLFQHQGTGMILSRLCSRLLSGSMNVSSMSQLAEVAKLLSGKLNTLGFGNLLAREVLKIHQVYEALGKPAPKDLLEALDTESAIELLGLVSRALREDQKICRISGSRGMGHILGLLQALFRRNTVVTVEGTIIQDIEHSNIVCEIIQSDRSEPTRIHLETSIPTSKPIELPIAILQTIPLQFQSCSGRYQFNWTGCIADQLQMIFLNYGFTCDQSILDACCDLLVLVPGAFGITTELLEEGVSWSLKYENFQPVPMLTLLGPLPRARICKICEEILHSKATTSQIDLSTAFSNFVTIVAGKVKETSCVCTATENRDWMDDWMHGWNFKDRSQISESCVVCQLWRDIGMTLDSMLWCFFVNAGPNTTISLALNQRRNLISHAMTGRGETLRPFDIRDHVMNLIDDFPQDSRMLAWGSNSCTIYPTVLRTLSVPSQQSLTFTLVEGMLVFEGRYHYHGLLAESVETRPRTTRVTEADGIRPSPEGMHIGSPTITIREGFEYLVVHCSLKSSGYDMKINLGAVIIGYMGMRWTNPCHHPMTDPMDLDKDRFQITSVASPAAEERFGVVMARWNPMAQFFCCDDDYQSILVKDCCLDCAAKGIRIGARVVFIVA